MRDGVGAKSEVTERNGGVVVNNTKPNSKRQVAKKGQRQNRTREGRRSMGTGKERGQGSKR
jgi:hypothetical protein